MHRRRQDGPLPQGNQVKRAPMSAEEWERFKQGDRRTNAVVADSRRKESAKESVRRLAQSWR